MYSNIVISKSLCSDTRMQSACKARTAEKTLSKNGIAATFRFHEGGETFHHSINTSAKSVGWRGIPLRKGISRPLRAAAMILRMQNTRNSCCQPFTDNYTQQ